MVRVAISHKVSPFNTIFSSRLKEVSRFHLLYVGCATQQSVSLKGEKKEEKKPLGNIFHNQH